MEKLYILKALFGDGAETWTKIVGVFTDKKLLKQCTQELDKEIFAFKELPEPIRPNTDTVPSSIDWVKYDEWHDKNDMFGDFKRFQVSEVEPNKFTNPFNI